MKDKNTHIIEEKIEKYIREDSEFYCEEDRNRFKVFFNNLKEINQEFKTVFEEIIDIDKKTKNNTVVESQDQCADKMASKFKIITPLISFFAVNEELLRYLRDKLSQIQNKQVIN
jgi:hypothetical protein